MKQPTIAKVIIIGGGVIGTSAAYHLAKSGIKECSFIRKKKYFFWDFLACSGNFK